MNKLFLLTTVFLATLSMKATADEWEEAIAESEGVAAFANDPQSMPLPSETATAKAEGRSSDDLNEAKFDADYENSDYQQLMRDEAFYKKEAKKNQSELQQAQAAYKQLKKKNAKLSEKIRISAAQASKHAQLTQQEVNRVSRLQDQAKQKEAEVERLRNKVESLKQKRDESKQKAQELAQNINELSRQKAQLTAEKKRAEKQLARYKLTKNQLNKKHKKLSQEVRKLQSRRQALR